MRPLPIKWTTQCSQNKNKCLTVKSSKTHDSGRPPTHSRTHHSVSPTTFLAMSLPKMWSTVQLSLMLILVILNTLVNTMYNCLASKWRLWLTQHFIICVVQAGSWLMFAPPLPVLCLLEEIMSCYVLVSCFWVWGYSFHQCLLWPHKTHNFCGFLWISASATAMPLLCPNPLTEGLFVAWNIIILLTLFLLKVLIFCLLQNISDASDDFPGNADVFLPCRSKWYTPSSVWGY